MRSWMRWLGIGVACMASGCVAGEASAPGSEEHVGAAEQRQIDPGQLVWRKILFTFDDPAHTDFGIVYVFNQALGSYQTGKEYWFVNLSSTSMVGRYGLTIASTDESSLTAPPDPSFLFEQSFVLTENVSWGSGWTTDPGHGGALYSGPGGVSLRVSTTAGGGLANVDELMWYQVIPSGSTPANVTPSGSFTTGGSSVTVRSGDLGYDIAQRI